MAVTIKIDGLDELLRDIDPKKIAPYLVRAGKKATLIVRNKLRTYPSPRSNNRRTGRLKRGWKAQVSNTGKTARVVNRERYAHIVQGGNPSQSWYKEVGWIQAEGIPKDRTLVGEVAKAYNDEIVRWTKEVG